MGGGAGPGREEGGPEEENQVQTAADTTHENSSCPQGWRGRVSSGPIVSREFWKNTTKGLRTRIGVGKENMHFWRNYKRTACYRGHDARGDRVTPYLGSCLLPSPFREASKCPDLWAALPRAQQAPTLPPPWPWARGFPGSCLLPSNPLI